MYNSIRGVAPSELTMSATLEPSGSLELFILRENIRQERADDFIDTCHLSRRGAPVRREYRVRVPCTLRDLSRDTGRPR